MNDEIKKGRGPTCPQKSLEQAVELAKTLFQKAGRSKVKPIVMASALNYSSLNGAAMTTLAVLNQYGLLEKDSTETLSVSDQAVRIIHPTSDDQKLQSLRNSALKPKVFEALYSGGFHHSSEDVISKHLIQSGFSEESAWRAAKVFLANISFAKLDSDSIKVDGEPPQKVENSVLKEPPLQPPVQQRVAPTVIQANELPVPIANGLVARVPFPMCEDDFNLLIETLKLWKKKLVSSDYPKQAIWHNADHDRHVVIMGVMGDKDGETYYRSLSGTGIPASQLEFVPVELQKAN